VSDGRGGYIKVPDYLSAASVNLPQSSPIEYPYFNTLDSIDSSVDCQKSAHSETSHAEINRSWEEPKTTITKKEEEKKPKI